MKKFLSYLIIFFTMPQITFAACSIEAALKPRASEPNYVSVLGALILVILLIYITGIIYTKLNLIGSKVVKSSRKNLGDDKILVLSTTPLGNNKSLHVVEVNGNKFLIGVAPTSITFLKELTTNTKNNSISKIDLVQEETKSSDALSDIFEIPTEQQSQDDQDYGLYKKYL